MEIGSFYCNILAGMRENGYRDPEQALEIAVAAGITAIDVTAGDFAGEAASVGKRIAACGAHITSVHDAVVSAYNDENAIRTAVDSFRRSMEAAAEAGSPRFMAVPLYTEEQPENNTVDPIFRQGVTEVLSRLTEHGKELGLTVTVENYSYRSSPYGSPDDILALLRQIPGLRFNFDSGNFPLAGFSETDAAKQLAPWTDHVHLKDLSVSSSPCFLRRYGQYFDSRAIGQGDTANREVLQILSDGGFDGAMIIEIMPQERIFDMVLDSAAYLISDGRR